MPVSGGVGPLTPLSIRPGFWPPLREFSASGPGERRCFRNGSALTTLLRALLGYDSTPRELALSFLAALFVIGVVAPGLSELLGVGPEGSAMTGALLGLTARPLLEALMQLARGVRQDALGLLRAWIARRWD